ncbi:MAG: caspase domain-containing protein [Hyphomicrobiaceae bacterium]
MTRTITLLILAFILSVPGSAAHAGKRIALVIGNADYTHAGRLSNPPNDGKLVAAALREIGFDDVDEHYDLPFDRMRLVLKEFSRASSVADVAIVYYAGHGIEVDGQNYLIPTDAKLSDAGDVDFEAIPLQTVLNSVEGTRKLKLVILDACRDNPFRVQLAGRRQSTRSLGRGLARVEPEVNTLVAFSAKEGTVALDGDGANSPFALALASEFKEPGLEIGLLFRRVRDRVLDTTGRRQEPFTYGSLGGAGIFLRPQVAALVSQTASDADPAPATSGGSTGGLTKAPLSAAALAWDVTKDTESQAVLKAFIAQYPDTVFAILAKARLGELEAHTQVASAADTATAATVPSVTEEVDRSSSQATAGTPADQSTAAGSDGEGTSEETAAAVDEAVTDEAATDDAAADDTTDETATDDETETAALSDDASEDGTEADAADEVTDEVEIDSETLTRDLQTELQRVGCYAGSIDGIWGSGSVAGLEEFNGETDSDVVTDEPTVEALGILKGVIERICPLSCDGGFEEKDGRCVREPGTVAKSVKPKRTVKKKAVTRAQSSTTKKKSSSRKASTSSSRKKASTSSTKKKSSSSKRASASTKKRTASSSGGSKKSSGGSKPCTHCCTAVCKANHGL